MSQLLPEDDRSNFEVERLMLRLQQPPESEFRDLKNELLAERKIDLSTTKPIDWDEVERPRTNGREIVAM